MEILFYYRAPQRDTILRLYFRRQEVLWGTFVPLVNQFRVEVANFVSLPFQVCFLGVKRLRLQETYYEKCSLQIKTVN